MAPVCSNCGSSDFVWANDLKTGLTGSGGLSLRSRGEIPLGTRICRSCGHADLFLRDITVLHQPHTWRPGEFIPIAGKASAKNEAPAPPLAPAPPPTAPTAPTVPVVAPPPGEPAALPTVPAPAPAPPEPEPEDPEPTAATATEETSDGPANPSPAAAATVDEPKPEPTPAPRPRTPRKRTPRTKG